MIGGLVRYFAEKRGNISAKGVLFCSGLIAGEGLAGILLALLAVIGVSGSLDLSGRFDLGIIGTVIMLALIISLILFYALRGNDDEKNNG